MKILNETNIFSHFLTVPGKSQPVGIYVPKNGPKGHPKITSRPKPRPKRKTPQPRPQPKPKSKRPMFQINIAPNSPLRKLYEMSKSKSEKVIQNLKKVKLKDHRYIKSKHSKFCFWKWTLHFLINIYDLYSEKSPYSVPRQTLMDTLLPCERDFVKKSGLTRGITVKLGDKELFGHSKIVPQRQIFLILMK